VTNKRSKRQYFQLRLWKYGQHISFFSVLDIEVAEDIICYRTLIILKYYYGLRVVTMGQARKRSFGIKNFLNSHNLRFEFKKYDKSLMPLSWKKRTIESNMDGQHLKMDFFGYSEAWELFIKFQVFLTSRLN